MGDLYMSLIHTCWNELFAQVWLTPLTEADERGLQLWSCRAVQAGLAMGK